MNASQRRIARRSLISAFPVGTPVVLDTGKVAKVENVNNAGTKLIVKRGDNRRVEFRPV